MRDAPPKSQLRFRFLFFEASTTWAKYENHDVFTDLAIAGIGTYSNKKYVCISSILSVVFAFSKRLPNRKIHHHHWGLSSLSSFLSFPNLQGSTEVLQLSLVYIRGWYFEGDLSNSLRKHGLCWLLQVWMFISRNFTIKMLDVCLDDQGGTIYMGLSVKLNLDAKKTCASVHHIICTHWSDWSADAFSHSEALASDSQPFSFCNAGSST